VSPCSFTLLSRLISWQSSSSSFRFVAEDGASSVSFDFMLFFELLFPLADHPHQRPYQLQEKEISMGPQLIKTFVAL
jgi:hypothetical protein